MRYGVLATGLIVGVPWGALHFLMFFWWAEPSGALPLAIFVPLDLFSVVVGMAAFRVLMVWVYDRTGKSMLVAIAHAREFHGLHVYPRSSGAIGVAFLTYLFQAAVLWVFVGAVAVANGGHLSRQPPSPKRVA